MGDQNIENMLAKIYDAVMKLSKFFIKWDLLVAKIINEGKLTLTSHFPY